MSFCPFCNQSTPRGSLHACPRLNTTGIAPTFHGPQFPDPRVAALEAEVERLKAQINHPKDGEAFEWLWQLTEGVENLEAHKIELTALVIRVLLSQFYYECEEVKRLRAKLANLRNDVTDEWLAEVKRAEQQAREVAARSMYAVLDGFMNRGLGFIRSADYAMNEWRKREEQKQDE